MSELSKHYNTWHNKNFSMNFSRAEESFNNEVLNILDVRAGQTLLDVGCGRGSFCVSANNRRLQVAGVDFSKVALAYAKSLKQNIEFVLADAHSLPYSDQFFDYVVCLGSLEHFLDKKKVLKEIRRVLKSDGKVFIFLPNSYFLGHIYMVFKTGKPPDEAGQSFSEDFNTSKGWKNLLEENGFRILYLRKYNTILGSNKFSPFTKFIYNRIIKYFIPFNLSYAFGYLCIKK